MAVKKPAKKIEKKAQRVEKKSACAVKKSPAAAKKTKAPAKRPVPSKVSAKPAKQQKNPAAKQERSAAPAKPMMVGEEEARRALVADPDIAVSMSVGNSAMDDDDGVDADVAEAEARTMDLDEVADEVSSGVDILDDDAPSDSADMPDASDLEDTRMTATQYQGGKKVLYTTVDAYESEMETKYRHVAWIFAYLLSAYERIPFNPEITVSYNDAARKDPDQMRLAALQELNAGIISKAEYRVRIFGEDMETAEAKVPQKQELGIEGYFN